MAKVFVQGPLFYQLYFQQEGVAEAEFEADIAAALRRPLFCHFRDGEPNEVAEHKPAEAKLLGWIDQSKTIFPPDKQRGSGGFCRGIQGRWLSRFRSITYRARNIDFQDMTDFAGKPVTRPSCFIAGERDAVRAFMPGMDLCANPGASCIRFRRLPLRFCPALNMGAAGSAGGTRRAPAIPEGHLRRSAFFVPVHIGVSRPGRRDFRPDLSNHFPDWPRGFTCRAHSGWPRTEEWEAECGCGCGSV